MKNKKLLVLASLLTAGLLVGCGGNVPSEVQSIIDEYTSTSQTSQEDASSQESSVEISSEGESSVAPVATVTGVTITDGVKTLEANETVTLHATVTLSSGEDKLGVTWASSNENVATVDENGLVTALSVTADTEVTITATSKKDGSVKQSITITVKADENKTLFGDKANMTNGDQAAAIASPGTFVEWHDQNWCGGNVTLHEAYSENNSFKLTYEATSGEVWYGMQLFYKNASLVAGTPYKLSMKINSSLACAITVNGKVVNLVEGNNDVEISYIEAANGASINIQMGVDGGATVLGATITCEVEGWKDISADKVALAAPTNVVASAKEGVDGAYVLSFDSVEHALGYMYSIYNAEGEAVYEYAACSSGDTIDLRQYETGAYSIKVQAVGDGLEYNDSAATEITINHTKPTAVVAQTYHASLGSEATALSFGEAAKASTTPTYWNDQGWCGSYTTVSYSAAKDDQIQFEFAGATIEYGFQLFLNDANVNTGSTYRLKMNLWSSEAGTVVINGSAVTLVAGDNLINVEYTAATSDQYGNAIASGITFKNNTISAATMKMSNIRWTEVVAGVEDSDIGTACEEPADLLSRATVIAAPEGVVYNTNGTMAWAAVTNASSYKVTVYADAACTEETSVKDVSLANGAAIDLSSLEAGTYYAKVFAVAADGTVSEGSTAVTITLTSSLNAPVGVVYNAGESTMAWAAVAGAESYKATVYSDAACTTETSIKDVAIANGGVLDVSSLEAGTYYAKVYAVKGETVSEGSSAVTITIAAKEQEQETPSEGDDEVQGDYTATLSSGVGGAWVNMTISFNGNEALTMDNVDLSSAKIVTASGATLKSTGKVGVETIDAKTLKVGIGFSSAEFVAEQNHTFTIVITVDGQAYLLTEVFTGKADTSDAKFTVISQSIEETTVEEKKVVEVSGTATVLASGSSDTRIEGAGAWIWIDPTSIGLTGENIASASGTATVDMKDGAGNAVARTANQVIISDLTSTFARVYVVMDGGTADGWTTTINFTITVGETAYAGTASFNGTAYVAK